MLRAVSNMSPTIHDSKRGFLIRSSFTHSSLAWRDYEDALTVYWYEDVAVFCVDRNRMNAGTLHRNTGDKLFRRSVHYADRFGAASLRGMPEVVAVRSRVVPDFVVANLRNQRRRSWSDCD